MTFMLGCNYWASNAGTEMWVNWDEAVIDHDLQLLSQNGLKYLRVFPNWRDFQPVCAFYGASNRVKEYRHTNGHFFDNPNYLDMEMIGRFRRFCKIAAKYDMKLIIGILTGWMSGRMFTPPLLEGKNLFKDETALLMEEKFIRGFVTNLYNEDSIYAWELGNECNVMSEAGNRETAAVWTAMVVNAIKANDPSAKPVLSGMHGLGVRKEWNVFDQGEHVDILTTHPYPHFVNYCFKDDMTSFRTMQHAACEGIYYRDLGGKPCLTEEMGTLGPMTCNDRTAAAFLKTNLYSNWAAGHLGLFWWCGCEQVNLQTAPYTWCMMERELGLLDQEQKPRKTLLTYKEFSKWLKSFGKELPAAQTDAVCILTDQSSEWGIAYMSYALAKQAHVNLKFAYGASRVLPESDVYLMPSISGTEVVCKETFDMLLDKVAQGATIYISNNDGWIAEFEKLSGLHVRNSLLINEELSMRFGEDDITFWREKRYIIEDRGAQVLAYDSLGMPAFTKYSYGKGAVYYLNFPLESMLLDKNNAFDSNCYRVYSKIFEDQIKKHPVDVENPYVGISCHYREDVCYVVMINYSTKTQEINLSVNKDYEIIEIYGGDIQLLPAHEATVITLRKK